MTVQLVTPSGSDSTLLVRRPGPAPSSADGLLSGQFLHLSPASDVAVLRNEAVTQTWVHLPNKSINCLSQAAD